MLCYSWCVYFGGLWGLWIFYSRYHDHDSRSGIRYPCSFINDSQRRKREDWKTVWHHETADQMNGEKVLYVTPFRQVWNCLSAYSYVAVSYDIWRASYISQCTHPSVRSPIHRFLHSSIHMYVHMKSIHIMVGMRKEADLVQSVILLVAQLQVVVCI